MGHDRDVERVAHTDRRLTDAAGNKTTSTSVTVTVANTVSGLVAAYSFNEGTGAVINDSSGKGNNGTMSNAAWTASGKFGTALSFNGTNAWVTVPDPPSLDLTTGMTLEAWLDPASLSSWRAAIMKETSNDMAYSLYANTSGNRIAGYVGDYELNSPASGRRTRGAPPPPRTTARRSAST